MDTTLRAGELRRPYAGALWSVLGIAAFLWPIGLLALLTGAAPSDPCSPGDRSCGPEPLVFLEFGLVSLLAGSVAGLAAAWFGWRRSQLVFAAPPSWPSPPAGWVPPSGWVPDPRWPAAPAGWSFWHRRS